MTLSSLKRMLEFDAMIGIIIVITSVGGMSLMDPDFFWHLKNGELLLANRVLFEQDLFSHTAAGTHLQVTGWFFDAAIAFLWQNYGAIGVRILSAFFIALTWLGMYKCATLFIQRKETCALFALFGIALLAPLVAVRPNLFTHCAVVWVLFCLLGFMKSNRINYLLSLIPLFAVWPNFHYGFAVGLVLIGLFFASAVLDRLAPLSSSRPLSGFLRSAPILISVTCVLAVAVNPYGLQVYQELLLMSMRATDSIVSEWQSPNFKAIFQKLLLVSIFSYLVVIFVTNRKSSWLMLLVPGTMLFAMLVAQRNQGFWAVILPAFLAIGVSEILTQRTQPESQLLRQVPHPQFAYFLNAVILLVTITAVLLGGPAVQQRQRDAAAAMIPAAATDFMLNKIPDGNLFNRYASGGYLIWRTYPRFPVFVDGRYSPYTPEIMNTYGHIIGGLPKSVDLLKNHNVEIALVDTNTALSELLYLSQDYRTVYSDPEHSIYVIDTDKFAQVETVERTTTGLETDK
jgi:hypothetical protein